MTPESFKACNMTKYWSVRRESGAWRDHHCSRCLKRDAVLSPGLGPRSCFCHCATAQTRPQHTQLPAQPFGKVSGFSMFWITTLNDLLETTSKNMSKSKSIWCLVNPVPWCQNNIKLTCNIGVKKHVKIDCRTVDPKVRCQFDVIWHQDSLQ